jgi:hypothetical protein
MKRTHWGALTIIVGARDRWHDEADYLRRAAELPLFPVTAVPVGPPLVVRQHR